MGLPKIPAPAHDRSHRAGGMNEKHNSSAVYHIALLADWEASQSSGHYRISTWGKTLADVGFIHCSYANQIVGTLRRFYSNCTEALVLLEINTADLGSSVVAEKVGLDVFPHLYGPLPVAAVYQVTPMNRDPDSGEWIMDFPDHP